MSKRTTTKEFITKSRAIHGNKYMYTNTIYVSAKVNVHIYCPTHGEFHQTPDNHLQGKGCRECANERIRESVQLTQEEAVDKFKVVHGDTYDYSLTNYIRSDKKVRIICKIHGEFQQLPDNHFLGRGCKICGGLRTSASRKKWWKINPRIFNLTHDNVISRFKSTHGDRYRYDLVEYDGCKDKVTIVCEQHGPFLQAAESHMRGQGCRTCAKLDSKAEVEIYEWVQQYFPDVERNNRQQLGGKELDIFIPSKKFAIEFNGLYYHSDSPRVSKNPITRHKEKTDICKTNGIHLFHLFEDDWNNIKDTVKHTLLHLLGVSKTRIYARKTTIKKHGAAEVSNFFNNYHMQGATKHGVGYGLYLGDELVACMVFSKPSSERGNMEIGRYELLRYACKYSIVGGASKLLSHFLNLISPTSVVSYSDDAMFTGNMYNILGFQPVSKVKPDYQVIFKGSRVHKSNFRLDRLSKLLGDKFDPTLTEKENCHNNGLWRIYNSGLTKWELDLK